MNMMQYASQVQAQRGGVRVPGLPAVPGQRAPMSGSTTTNLSVPAEITSVANQPSMKLERLPDGGIATVIERKLRFPNLLDEKDLQGIRRWVERAVQQMVNQSQGPLSRRQLAKMGHPYGRNAKGLMRGRLGRIGRVAGVRGSVSNLSVVNRQSGALARSWGAETQLRPSGVRISLINAAAYAQYLGMGTVRMQAHGPFSSVPTSMMAQLNSEWQKAVRAAYRRKAIEAQAATMFGG